MYKVSYDCFLEKQMWIMGFKYSWKKMDAEV